MFQASKEAAHETRMPLCPSDAGADNPRTRVEGTAPGGPAEEEIRRHDPAARLRADLRRAQDQLALSATVLELIVAAQTEEELVAVAALVGVLSDQLPIHRA